MNTKNNQRAKDTDEKIVRAMYQVMLKKKKTIAKITVREICEEAAINRSTFYAHYQDVFGLLEQVERSMAEQLTGSFLEQLEKGANLAECFESLFAFIKKNQKFYAIYFAETHRVGVIGVAWDLLQEKLSTVSFKEMGFQSEEEMAYHSEFFLHGLTAMIRQWVINGCEETPRQMFQMLERQYSADKSLFAW